MTREEGSVSTLSIVLIAVIVGAVIGGTAYVVTRPKPNIQIKELTVSQEKVPEGEPVTVGAEVTNRGGARGSKTISLRIEGKVMDSHEVTLSPGETDMVTFEVTMKKAGSYDLSVGSLSETIEVLETAKFEVSDLKLSSSEVEVGKPVDVSVDVRNVSNVKGSYTVRLSVGGGVEKTEEVELGPGKSKTVSFSVIRNQAGTFTAKISGLSKSFKILPSTIFELKERYPKVYFAFSGYYSPYENGELLFAKSILKICDLNPAVQNLKGEELLYLIDPRPICGAEQLEFVPSTENPESVALSRWVNQELQCFLEEVIPLANRIANGKTGEKVKCIQQWVNKNLESRHPRGCDFKSIWEQRMGVCDEKSTLIVAMNKAVGIPSRKVDCSPINHAWVEAYMENKWVSIASTGALDSNNDWIIDQEDLHARKNGRYMYDVFTHKPLGEQKDITYAYNDFLLNKIFDKSKDLLEKYNYQKKNYPEMVKDLLDLWHKAKSRERKDWAGREIVELSVKKIARVTENVPEEEVSLAEFASYEKGPGFNLGKKGEVLYFLDLIAFDSLEGILDPRADLGQMGATFDPDPVSALKCILEKKKEVKLILAGGVPFKINVLSRKDISEMLQFIPKFYGGGAKSPRLKEILTGFVVKVIEVENGTIPEATYNLPVIENVSYRISAVGPFEYRNDECVGHSLQFSLIAEKSIGGFTVRMAEYPDFTEVAAIMAEVGETRGIRIENKVEEGRVVRPRFVNLVFVDESGKKHKPDTVENLSVYAPCPSELVDLNEGRSLHITTEGNPKLEFISQGPPLEGPKYFLWRGDLVYIEEELSES